MKGVIVNCLKELVVSKFGAKKWEEALIGADFDRHESFLVTQDVDDSRVLKLVGSVCKTLGISLEQAADAFGEYWACTYAPRIYSPYYRTAHNAKEFLLQMDEVHRLTTMNIQNAKPPRFTYEWKNDSTLIMKYHSDRGLIDFLAGLARGVGKYYKENIAVTKVGKDAISISFPT